MSTPEYVVVLSSEDEDADDDSIEILELREHTQAILDKPPPQPHVSSTGSSNSSIVKKLGDAQCPICFDDITCAAATSCGHVFCLECIQQGIASSQARGQVGGSRGQGLCPLCRKHIHFKDVVILRVREMPHDYYDRAGPAKDTVKSQLPSDDKAATNNT